MTSQNSQESNELLSEEVPGGYVAIYHEVEEMNYGPLFGMPAKWRVFFCIRHKLLRDGLCEKHIGTEFIREKTGLTKSQIKAAIKALQKDGLILSNQNVRELSNKKLVYGENSYYLNPAIFGEIYNWYKQNPTVRVHEAGQAKSYSRLGMYQDPGVRSRTGGGIKSDTGGVSEVAPGTELKFSELLEKIVSNNPSSNNPKENNPSSEEIDLNSQGSGTGTTPRRRTREEQEEIIRQQVADLKAGRL